MPVWDVARRVGDSVNVSLCVVLRISLVDSLVVIMTETVRRANIDSIRRRKEKRCNGYLETHVER